MINKNYGKLINNNIVYAPNELSINNMICCFPTEEQYYYCGYKKVIKNQQNNVNCYNIKENITETETELIINFILTPMTNNEISNIRTFQYETRTDKIYLKYQIEQTRGNTEEANKLLQQWNNECNLIKTEYPYFNN